MTDNILELANSAVGGERGDDYGHPLDDFTRSAEMISGLLGYPVKPSDIPLIMICIKLSRQKNQYKADNLVDIAGYALTAEMVHEEAIKRDDILQGKINNNYDISYTGPVFRKKIEVGLLVAMDRNKEWFKYKENPIFLHDSWMGEVVDSDDIDETTGFDSWKESLFLMTETGLVKV